MVAFSSMYKQRTVLQVWMGKSWMWKALSGQTGGRYLFTGGGKSIQDDRFELWLAAQVHMVPHLAQGEQREQPDGVCGTTVLHILSVRERR